MQMLMPSIVYVHIYNFIYDRIYNSIHISMNDMKL